MKTQLSLLLFLVAVSLPAAPFAPMPPALTNGPAFDGVPLLARHDFVQRKYGQAVRWQKLAGPNRTAGDIKGTASVSAKGKPVTAEFFLYQVGTNDYRLHQIIVTIPDEPWVIEEEVTKQYGPPAKLDGEWSEWKLPDGNFHITVWQSTDGSEPDKLYYKSGWGQAVLDSRTKGGAGRRR